MTITPALVACIHCGRASTITMTMERNGVLAHYGSCLDHLHAVADRVARDADDQAARVHDRWNRPAPTQPAIHHARDIGNQPAPKPAAIETTATD